MFSNHKVKLLICTSIIFSTQSIYAKQSDAERVNIISQSMIDLFGQTKDQDQVNIKFAAAIHGISEVEAKKNRDENGEAENLSSAEKMLSMMKDQFSDKDLKIIGPAFKRQMKAQGDVYNSCKPYGKPIKSKLNYEIPLTCDVPVVDFESLKMPKKTSKESDAQYMAKFMNLSTDLMLRAPKETFKTSILIRKSDDLLIPEMDDIQYFPTSVTNKITGTTEEELNKE